MPVLFVRDISISKRFYQDLFSLKIENDFGENISFKEGFSLWQKKRAEEIIFNSKKQAYGNEGKNLELYFETSNIEAVWKRIKQKSINLIHGLKEEPWGQRTIRIFDPDNFIIEIAEPLSQVILRFADEGKSYKKISMKTQMPLKAVKKILENKEKNSD